MKNYLEFEHDIKALEEEIEKLKDPFNKEGISEVETEKISKIEKEINEKLKISYSSLNEWQKTQVARHEDRPKAKFFIENLFSNFINLSGDRRFSEDESVIAGFAEFNGKSVLVIGQEKGEDLDTRLKRNFGMVSPSGYRKAIRLMKLADKFNIPVISFIDTPGAAANISAEKMGQAEAIASSIECQMSLKVPVIAIVIGEGGSGGAIALASANKVLMLENAIYSVISPEGCATILWKDPSKTLEAAKAMKLTATELLKIGVIDEVIDEPLGGAHRNKLETVKFVELSIKKYLEEFSSYSREEILEQIYKKFLIIGKHKSFNVFSKKSINLLKKDSLILMIKENFFRHKYKFLALLFLILIAVYFSISL